MLRELDLREVFFETLKRCDLDRRVFDMLEPRADNTGFAVPRARFAVKIEPPSKLWIFGAGKAAASMAQGALRKLEEQVQGGAIIVPKELTTPELSPLRLLRGTHPKPTQESLNATEALLETARECQPKDHVLFFLSGGASALFAKPVKGLAIEQKAKLAEDLMQAGADISALNTVRRHLSHVKGGQSARLFNCPVTVFIASDVAGNAIHAVGSGPFAADPTTKEQAAAVLRRFGQESFEKFLIETPKQDVNIQHILVASGETLLAQAASFARSKGFEVQEVHEPVQEEVRVLAAKYATLARSTRGLTICFGEPIIQARRFPLGQGGRSQHLALLLARELSGVPGWSFLAAGSDGVDGSSPAAGAVVDGTTWEAARKAGFEPERALERFDSHGVLKSLNCLVNSGPTGNNLQDLHLLYVRQS